MPTPVDWLTLWGVPLWAIALTIWGVVVAGIVAFCVVIYRLDKKASKGGKPVRSGVNIIEGLPGAGKSFLACRMIEERIISEARPVYTNLPIKFRVLRKYLRGRVGGRFVGFIQPLNEAGFRRFLDRFELFRAWMLNGGNEEGFIDQYGPHIETGDDLNWIPFGSIIMIDEVQSWFHMEDQKKETRNLGSFLQHHRHGLYEVWAMTQHPRLISITFRSFNDRTMVCMNMGKRPIIPGVYLPITLLVSHTYSGDRCKKGVPYGEAPDSVKSVIPALSGGRTWRFYQSHTIVGSRRKVERQLKATRERVMAMGVEEDEAAIAARREAKEQAMRGFIRRWFWRIAFTVSVFAVGAVWAWMKSDRGGAEQAPQADVVAVSDDVVKPPATQRQDNRLSAETTNGPQRSEPRRPVAPPPRLTAVGSGWVQLDGQIIELGGRFRDAVLVATEDEIGLSVWQLGPAVLRWRVGGVPAVIGVRNSEGGAS